MKVISICVGGPREVASEGKLVRTSIFKNPVHGPVRLSKLNLTGDEQSDLAVHGGIYKAVYAYPSEHYAFWREELPGAELPWGAFGENLTTEGLSEDKVNIGDRFRIGSAELTVTQPRMPCYKLGIKFGSADMVKRFLKSGRTGFYPAVVKEGKLSAGDSVEFAGRDGAGVTVADIVSLYTSDDKSLVLLRRAAELKALSPSWREHFRKQVIEAAAG